MRLSFGAWAFIRGPFEGNPVSLHATLHKLEDEGYQGVELSAYAPHPTPDSHATKGKRDSVRKEIADHGLAISALAPNLRSYPYLSVPDSGPYVAAFARYVHFATDLGIDAIRVDTVERTDAVRGVEPALRIERAARTLRLCAGIAADRGIRLCWEFEPHLALHEPDGIVALVDAVRSAGHANFGVLFDTSHARVCSKGNEFDLLRSLAGRINHIHLADSDGSVDEHGVSRHLPLGAGRLDFDRLLPELARTAPDAWWTVDLYNCPDAWDLAGAAKQYLDRAKSRLGIS